MSSENGSLPRKVWVLMFDRLQFDGDAGDSTNSSADESLVESNESDVNPFDDLDLQSTYVEQYLLQDTRSSARATAIPGTVDALQCFMAALRSANKSASHVRLTCVGIPADRVPIDEVQSVRQDESCLTLPGTVIPVIDRVVCCADAESDEINESQLRDDSFLQSALEADLVWIEARTESAKDARRAASKLLKLVQKLRSEATPTPAVVPVLIVSSMRRSTHEVAQPFISGLSESQIHVPLWIDHGAGHACRIQALTGSSDLLPTLCEYLTGTAEDAADAEDAEDSVSVREGLSDESVHLSSRPLSLVSACEHHKPLPDRLLRIRGDSWDALRTQQYLLVRSDCKVPSSDSAESSSGEEIQTTRRLYLKPDDVWNVNDAIVAYSAIADQMESMAADNERAELLGNNERRA